MSGTSLRRDIRGVLLALFSATGGLVGLWRGMLAAPTETPSPQAWTALADVMQPVLVGVGLGVTAGALVATGVCFGLPWLRPSRDRG